MAYDFALHPQTRDALPGFVTGPQETLQRLTTRLKRELGEWFLDNSAGLPWYQEGSGILGANASSKRTADLLIRREVLETEGVVRIVALNTVWSALSRTYSLYLEVIVDGAQAPQALTIEGEFS